MWPIGAMVCLLAASWVQLSVSVGNGWPHNVLRHHWLMPISCHFRDCKALLVTSLTHVSGAIASVLTFTFTFYYDHVDLVVSRLSLLPFCFIRFTIYRLLNLFGSLYIAITKEYLTNRQLFFCGQNRHFLRYIAENFRENSLML